MRLGIVRLYIGESGKLGYYNIQELGLAKSLAKRGIETYIFFLVSNKEFKDININEVSEKIKIVYVPAIKLFNHGVINPKFLLNYNLDIIHLLSDNQIMVPSFIKFCSKNNIPIYNYVGTVNSDSKNKIKRTLMNCLSNRNINYFKNNKTIVKTLEVKERLNKLGVNSCKVIPVGLDLDLIPKIDKSKNEIRNNLKIRRESKVLLFVGRLENYKDPLKSIELMRELVKLDRGYYLIIIGKGSLKDNLLDSIRKYHLQNNIRFIEQIENKKIHEYYKASDFFVNFNSNEIFGMSILEAMNQGCKVIAIEAPGPKYIIDNNTNGFLMKEFNALEWKDKINQNMNNNRIGIEANKKIIQCFSWEKISYKYLKLFDEFRGERNEKTEGFNRS